MPTPTHPLHRFRYCPACGHTPFAAANAKAKRCDACGFIYYFNPSAAVACFVRDADDRLMVVRRAKDPAAGTLDLAGGFADCGESAEEAIRREVKEETGLELTTLRYLFSFPNIYPYAGFDVHTVDLFYEGLVAAFDDAHAADDAAELVVLDPERVDASAFGLPSIRRGVEKYLSL